MSREYAAFISYRHLPLDMKVADTVHEMIERYVIPKEFRKNNKKHLGIAFRDQEELPLTSDLTGSIYEALDHSQYLIVICTPETSKSQWVAREIEYFVNKHGRDRVLTVLAAGTMSESVPSSITTIYGADGTVLGEQEPLAAMIAAPTQRQTLRLLRKEFPRLAAAMIGCPYDALIQRSKRRKMQLLSAAMGVVAAVAITFTGMLLKKNAEIDQQLQQALINESKALAYQSQSVLEHGSRYEAISLALSALPSEGSTRPYVAKAERSLTSALQVYNKYNLRIQSKIDVDTWDMVGTSDGKYVIVMSGEDRVHCFCVQNGKELWVVDVNDCNAIGKLFLTAQEQAVIVPQDSGATVIEISSGNVLRTGTWENDLPEGNLLLSELIFSFGGAFDPVNRRVYPISKDNVPDNHRPLSANLIIPVSESQFCFGLWDEKTLCFVDNLTGNIMSTIDISPYLDRFINGIYDDFWYDVYADGSVQLTCFQTEEKLLEFYKFDFKGNQVQTAVINVPKSFGVISVSKVAGTYLSFAGERSLIIINTEDYHIHQIDTKGKSYDHGLDQSGNALIIFEDRTVWYAPQNTADCNSPFFGIEVPDSFKECYSYYLAGCNVYYEEAGANLSNHLLQISGSNNGIIYEGVIPILDTDTWNQSGQIITYDGHDYLLQTEGYFTCTVTDMISHQEVGRYTVEDSMHGILFQGDLERGYLYVHDAYGWGTGQQIDMHTWEVVADIPDLFRYLPETNQVLCELSRGTTDIIYPLYTLDELLAMGNEILSGK